MIGRLHGTVAERHPPALLLDVGGVGYELEAPMSTFYALPAGDQAVTLWTHLAVRDDGQALYGFASRAERDLFRVLIRISGVGPKLALALLSGMNAEGLQRCIEREDVATLTRLPGVGRKTAQRLIVELRDRLDGLLPAASGGVPARTGSGEQLDAPAGPQGSREDAVSALVALGYKPAEAGRLVNAVPGANDLPSEELIRRALQAAVR
ncbi:Holliday junction branch migration protein RuvA [Alkalilimnicola ehrlichii MLHE-1]|uniref:Holliday junction branch migration complex subunit RuvA n=1 Tax=Alkalilimnicola ehrlichii (strain ATCC BAA-1101 / DSM 17681 / MLHE-1) TaxID=187272 RepID=RUVA_ALKEH|nr:Holliday junction branch migration protein RuvA [Alkalilimnicola ehrlichii]Q0A5Q3.1 RecName: Full=Holliday junction branch migration complex subunit RuvA [Alkalilimnicola ehrlichii MLHE-1]ABI57834.1 Holliday junction DNA helicase subunit RuvA [Alkalilimnicola ehrlichii MLHE-1]